MTKHTATNLVFAIVLITLLALSKVQPVAYYWYIIVLLLYFTVIGLGAYFIELDFFTHSLCHGDTSGRTIAITFDDGPNSSTEQILAVLKKENTHATFFCIGKNTIGNETIIQKINADGHLIGTHSLDHHWAFPLQSPSKIAAEIARSQSLISACIHKKPLLFRPPFGVTDPPLAAAIVQAKVTGIGWSLRSYDTVISSQQKLLKRISKIKNGDIVLFHDAGLQTANVLSQFIKHTRAQGFAIVPLDQLLAIQAYEQ